MRLRKIITVLSLMLCLALLCGCSSEPSRLNDGALVEAVGIDYEQEAYTVTLLVYKPSSEIGQIQNNTETISAKAESVSAAMELLAAELGRSPFFDNNRILVLGRSAAQEKLKHLMAFFASDHRIKPACFVVAAQGKAQELLSSGTQDEPPDQGYLQQILQAAVQQGTAFETTVLQLQKNAADDARDTALSLLKKGEKELEFDGALGLRGLTVQQQFDEQETRGLLLLLAQAQFPTVSLKQGEQVCSAVGYDCKSSFTLSPPEQPRAHIRVSLSFLPAECNGMETDEVKKALEREVERLCLAALSRLQDGTGDLLALGARYRRQYAAELKRLNLSPTQLASRTTCTVSVQAKMPEKMK